MFNNPRYLTAGVAAAIPEFLQLFMWQCIDRLPDDRDYLQVFRLEPFGGMQQISLWIRKAPAQRWHLRNYNEEALPVLKSAGRHTFQKNRLSGIRKTAKNKPIRST